MGCAHRLRRLTAASSGVSTALTTGKTYTSPPSLLKRGQAAIQDRTTSGSASHLSGMTGGQTTADSILYMITVNYHSAQDNADYELCYYLNLFDQLPAPSAADYQDVPARRVVLRRGGLCGLPRACSPAPAAAASRRSSP